MSKIKQFIHLRPEWSILFFFFFITGIQSYPQSFQYKREIKWIQNQKVTINEGVSKPVMMFEGSSRNEDEFGRLPLFCERFRMFSEHDSLSLILLENPIWETMEAETIEGVVDIEKVSNRFEIRNAVSIQRKKPFLNVTILPIRRNPETGNFEKLISFTLKMVFSPSTGRELISKELKFASNSVLSQGNWIKVSLVNTGIYKIPASSLKSVDPVFSETDPRTIKVFGNGGRMLPEANSADRIDDLREVSIQVIGEEDGVFNDQDYILFYAEGPDSWYYDKTDQVFHHIKHIYSDFAYYFITCDNGQGKRIGLEQSTLLPATHEIATFNDFTFYEKDGLNLIKSGREWYDPEIFELTTTRNYSFSFPDLDLSTPVKVQANVAARSTTESTSFSLYANNIPDRISSIAILPTSTNYLDNFARKNKGTGSFTSASSAIDLKLVYNKVPDAIGYLDFFEINVKRQLRISSNQLQFRSVLGSGSGNISEFTLVSPGKQSTIWDVSDPGNIKRIDASKTGDNYTFRLPTDTIREFVAFDGNGFFTIQSARKISNQNLHGITACDYIIITHPSFSAQANQLGAFHRDHDNMNVLITTPEVIYNEFSSGAQDLTGIRDFLRMLYNKAQPGQEPKYILLFGDASYDYKDRIPNNTNFVPTYESQESLGPVNTFVTDDYIALLDQNEGQNTSGDLDIGVGRLPVGTPEQAQEAVNKILHYTSNSEIVKNDWRNLLCFIADDEDSNLHMSQAETLTNMIGQDHKVYNIDKIYLDAYKQVSTPGGGRYPDVNKAINQRVTKGALIINYNGHGGELGWAHERVLEIPDIKSWNNFNNLSVFVTATCEFSRFDDPAWVSAGEWVFLNSSGGGVALFTTTRPTYADGNLELTRNFYRHAFNRTGGKFPKLGDLIVISKNLSGSGANTRKFVLLGDPGIQLAYPSEHVATTSVNQKLVKSVADTLKALANVEISGEIQDNSGNLIPTFNGTLITTVYDKSSEIVTLGNDGNTPFTFFLRKNIIYKGKVAVTNGLFTLSFIVPKDIAYQYGIGKISYYAYNDETDANGFDENIVVGGYDNGSVIDENGPTLSLFMNDTTFVSGGITDQNPRLLAQIVDESGINTVGSGIGHDLTGVLDNDHNNLIILNDYYTTNLNTFKSGNISYPFFNLSDGWHSISVKVWDVYNNSAETTIDFLVVSSSELILQNLLNYPNPFQNQTTFSFGYNHPNTDIDVMIRIFSFSGQLIKTINETIHTTGYHANTIKWDGTSDKGDKIGSGTYLYQLSVRMQNGLETSKTSKMIVIR